MSTQSLKGGNLPGATPAGKSMKKFVLAYRLYYAI